MFLKSEGNHTTAENHRFSEHVLVVFVPHDWTDRRRGASNTTTLRKLQSQRRSWGWRGRRIAPPPCSLSSIKLLLFASQWTFLIASLEQTKRLHIQAGFCLVSTLLSANSPEVLVAFIALCSVDKSPRSLPLYAVQVLLQCLYTSRQRHVEGYGKVYDEGWHSLHFLY